MLTKDFYYDLPKELIAQKPLLKRDHSRLLVYNRENGSVEHKIFKDITEYLKSGDALVINETKVIPARLFGKKKATGAKLEVLLLNRMETDVWEALLRPAKRLKVNDLIIFDEGLEAEVAEKKDEGLALIRFFYSGDFMDKLERIGHAPTPPYITEKLTDRTRYQTIYAKKEGSAAAPTAGFHFTEELLKGIGDMGVHILPILLHVGLGTFKPVKTKNISDHKMHSEYFDISGKTANKFNEVKKKGGRIIAVGTTTVRTLESVCDKRGYISGACGNTDIFIYPGYKFKTIDALVTNFHLPMSTLLMLVCAFMGHKETMSVYKTAVEERYRFFSFGDAMLIL